MSIQYGVFRPGEQGERTAAVYETEAAARNDPASLHGWVRVRRVVWDEQTRRWIAGRWQATDPSDPLWHTSLRPEPAVEPTADRLAGAILLVALVLACAGVAWGLWTLLAP